jgi:hypothetical protein
MVADGTEYFGWRIEMGWRRSDIRKNTDTETDENLMGVPFRTNSQKSCNIDVRSFSFSMWALLVLVLGDLD